MFAVPRQYRMLRVAVDTFVRVKCTQFKVGRVAATKYSRLSTHSGRHQVRGTDGLAGVVDGEGLRPFRQEVSMQTRKRTDVDLVGLQV
jgi:hypothetical protein